MDGTSTYKPKIIFVWSKGSLTMLANVLERMRVIDHIDYLLLVICDTNAFILFVENPDCQKKETCDDNSFF